MMQSPDFLQESEASLAKKRRSQDYGEKWGAGLLERAGIGDTGFLVDLWVQGHQLCPSLFDCQGDLPQTQR